MDKQQLEAIRARDEVVRKFDDCMPTEPMSIGDYDRRVLLAYVDELLARHKLAVDNWTQEAQNVKALTDAARKVTCKRCDDSGKEPWSDFGGTDAEPCYDCADLRRLLGEVKS